MLARLLFAGHRIATNVFNRFDQEPKSGNFLTETESLELLAKSRKSLIRWGDGESTLLLGGDVYFQQGGLRLSAELTRMARGYTLESPYLLALPHQFLSCSRRDLVARGKDRTWSRTRYAYALFFPDNGVPYLDSFLFREDSSLSNEAIHQLWATDRTIIFVHNNFKYFVDFRAANPEKDVRYVPVFSANAHASSADTAKQVLRIAETVETNSLCVLVSAGPGGKIIVARLAERGLRALDVGHYFDYKFYGIMRDTKAR